MFDLLLARNEEGCSNKLVIMSKFEFNFGEEEFSKLFPFYILIDSALQIVSFGKSLKKVCRQLEVSEYFSDTFSIQSPFIENPTFQRLTENTNEFIIIQSKKDAISFKGQFERLGNQILFLGTPWFVSMDQVINKNLTKHDFALYDPLLDLLHVLNNQTNTEKDLKELLTTINNQKNKLKKDQEELNRLSLVASSNQNGVVFTQAEGLIFWCNDAYLKQSGYSKEEVIGKTPIEIGNCENTNVDELRKMKKSFYNGEPFDVELVHRRKDGGCFWTNTKGQPILDKSGNVIQYFAIVEDISLKKRYDESLQIEKEKYGNIIANMNLGLIEIDLKGKIASVNQSFSKISGFSVEELIGKNASDILLSLENKKILDSKIKLRSQGISDSYEVSIINKKGEKRNWLTSAAPNFDINGTVIGSIGIHLDITKQKEQEEQLYLLSLIADKNINSVIICDNKGKIEWVNTSFIEMTGFPMDELVGKKPGTLLQGPETNPETIQYMKDHIDNGKPFNCEIINYSKTGEKYWVSINGQALYNKNNEIIKFFAIEENITNKKLLENQREELVASLANSNRELEDYAQIVSHDLKSPLHSIHSLISWIKEDNDKDFNNQTLKYLSMIENKVEKMDHLIEGILTYSKIDKVDVVFENVNTHDIVQNIFQIIHIPKNVTVRINSKLPIIKADRFRIQQLFQNIISNAVIYTDKPDGVVEIDCQELPENYLFSIKDNGQGIAKENHKKIFKIFQSLTTSDKSTGLGLSIVKKIVDSYKGRIWMESELGKGTIFFIELRK